MSLDRHYEQIQDVQENSLILTDASLYGASFTNSCCLKAVAMTACCVQSVLSYTHKSRASLFCEMEVVQGCFRRICLTAVLLLAFICSWH